MSRVAIALTLVSKFVSTVKRGWSGFELVVDDPGIESDFYPAVYATRAAQPRVVPPTTPVTETGSYKARRVRPQS
jgi:hypothetical protein